MSATTTVAKHKEATPALAAYSLNKPEELAGLAALLQHHIQEKRLFTDIQGKKFVNVEGWQFAGAMLGIVPIVEKVEDSSTHAAHVFKGWGGKPDTTVAHTEFRATVALHDLRSGQVVGRGIASCSNLESKKRTFDPYAVESMAQTRAVGKAFRLLIAWVMQAGGYATTPVEEMPDAEPETSAAVVVLPAAPAADPAPLRLELRNILLELDKGLGKDTDPRRTAAWDMLDTLKAGQLERSLELFKEQLAALVDTGEVPNG